MWVHRGQVNFTSKGPVGSRREGPLGIRRLFMWRLSPICLPLSLSLYAPKIREGGIPARVLDKVQKP